MKIRLIAVALLALSLTGPALAGGATDTVDIAALAERANLTERQVRMVLGKPTAFSEYRTSYARSYNALKSVVGGKRQMEMLAQRYARQQRAASARTTP